MKRLLLTTTALLAASAAYASDLNKPAVVTPNTASVPYSWTGAYVGADLGYGFGTNGLVLETVPASLIPFGVDAGLAPHGFTLGGNVGYDYEIGSKFVVGVVGDISWSDISDSNNIISGPGGSVNASSKLLWEGDVRGRAGYLLSPSVLVYGTAGAAFGGASATGSITGLGSLTASATNIGWTAGAGLEYAWTTAWHLKAEWLHTDLGSVSACAAIGSGHCIGFSSKITDDVYKAGVAYRF